MPPLRTIPAIFAVLTLSQHLLAQSSDQVAAEALFQEGVALLEEGNANAACPKLAESHRLDAATGTLMALSLCNEAVGKLASAWAGFTEVEGRARREGRAGSGAHPAGRGGAVGCRTLPSARSCGRLAGRSTRDLTVSIQQSALC